MKIRSYFAVMATTIVLIPVVIVVLSAMIWNLGHGPSPIPTYDELPRSEGLLTDAKTWDQVRLVLLARHVSGDTYVFDPEFRVIYASKPLGLAKKGRDPMTIQDAIAFLKGSDVPKDILLYQPGGTRVWILQVSGQVPPTNAAAQKFLWAFALLLLVVLVLSVALALVLGGGLANSVVRLEQAARRLSTGDKGTGIQTKSANDEIRSLGRALETMRQALLEEDARQSRFVMGVSHDLKTPLALIKGYVELLRDNPQADAEALEARFDLILDKADQLDGMIDHLIDYSKVSTDDWQRTWKPLELRNFLEDFCRSLGPDSELLHRTLVSDLRISHDVIVDCDERSIRRCLENLVHNALRYTPEGGTVGVRALQTPDVLSIIVWDNGPGIDPEDLPHLFDAFYRGTRSRRENGMGLGLSIVKNLLDSHGWTIKAESANGARFTILIPWTVRRRRREEP